MLTLTNLVGFAGEGAVPLGYVGLVGTPVSAGTSGTTLTITVPSAIPAGETLVVCGTNKDANDAFTASDTRGNTYTRRVQTNDGNRASAILTATLTTALQAGDIITLTYPVSAQVRTMLIYRLAGVLTGAFHSAVANGTTADPNMSVVNAEGFVCYVVQENNNAETGTPPAGWTEDLDVNGINGSVQIGHKDAFVSPAATTAVNPTTSGTSLWISVALSIF